MVENYEGAKEILATEKDEDLREMAKEEIAEIEPKLPQMEQDIKLLLPCESDRGSSFCQSRACDKVYRLIDKHYPDKCQIACG